MNKKGKYSYTGGFTLIETFVAITILMMVIITPLTLAQKSLSSDSLVKEKMTAYFLAQDMVEYVRSLRDNNNLLSEQDGWNNFKDELRSKCEEDYGNPPQCTIDTLNGTIKSGSDYGGSWESFPTLDYMPSKSAYGYANGNYGNGAGQWETSPFKRGLRITCLNSINDEETKISCSDSGEGKGNEISIKVIVSWESEGYGHQEITLRDTLLNW